MIYTVGPGSRISLRGVRRLLQLENTSLVGVVRDGRLLRPRDLDRLEPGDSVLVIAPPAQAAALDELFARTARVADDDASFGEFTFDGELPVGKLAEFYDLPVPEAERAMPLADFRAGAPAPPAAGRRPRPARRHRAGRAGGARRADHRGRHRPRAQDAATPIMGAAARWAATPPGAPAAPRALALRKPAAAQLASRAALWSSA